MIWASVIFGIVISIIAISGLSIAWYSLHEQVKRNEEVIVHLCRDINEHNRSIITLALDFGVPPYQLEPFKSRPCTIDHLREDAK